MWEGHKGEGKGTLLDAVGGIVSKERYEQKDTGKTAIYVAQEGKNHRNLEDSLRESARELELRLHHIQKEVYSKNNGRTRHRREGRIKGAFGGEDNLVKTDVP